MGIQNLGYELVRTDGLTGFWFNRGTGACARITTSEGRYSNVRCSRPKTAEPPEPSALIWIGKPMKNLFAASVILVAMAGCAEEQTFTTEADISEANRATDCPVDVSEADRANYPACN